MPQPSSSLGSESHLKTLVVGEPKFGKSTCVISTAPGPVYVITADDKSSMAGAHRRAKFDWDIVNSWEQMDRALRDAREGVKAGKYNTVVLDGLTRFSDLLSEQCLASTDNGKGPDGRRAWPDYTKRIVQVVENLKRLPCHFLALAHYLRPDDSTDDDGKGNGVLPLLFGAAKKKVAAAFNEIVLLDIRKGERFFCTNEARWPGVATRAFDGPQVVPADVQNLINLLKSADKAPRKPVGVAPRSTVAR
jgi:hypothetical protein